MSFGVILWVVETGGTEHCIVFLGGGGLAPPLPGMAGPLFGFVHGVFEFDFVCVHGNIISLKLCSRRSLIAHTYGPVEGALLAVAVTIAVD